VFFAVNILTQRAQSVSPSTQRFQFVAAMSFEKNYHIPIESMIEAEIIFIQRLSRQGAKTIRRQVNFAALLLSVFA